MREMRGGWWSTAPSIAVLVPVFLEKGPPWRFQWQFWNFFQDSCSAREYRVDQKEKSLFDPHLQDDSHVDCRQLA